MSDDEWYETLRNQFRPDRVSILFIGESPPDPRAQERRFFYAPQLRIDNLYRGVSEALYGLDETFNVRDKAGNLNRMKSDGVWLVDAVDVPVNARTITERRKAIRSGLPKLLDRCVALEPATGVIVCHSVVFREAAGPMRNAGVKVLHEVALPFPLGNHRRQFVEGVRAALAGNRDH